MYVIQVNKDISGKRMYGGPIEKIATPYLHLIKNSDFDGEYKIGTLSCLSKAARFNSEEEARVALQHLQDIYDDIVTYEIINIKEQNE